MEYVAENDWTTVSRKNTKKHNKPPFKNKPPPSENKPPVEFRQQHTIYGGSKNFDPLENGYRLMTEKDYNLTPTEKKMLNNSGYELFCCLCCDDTSEISTIIGRRVYQCGTCYCCMGDDPFGDICTVYVNDITGAIYMSASKEDMEQLSEFNKKYNEYISSQKEHYISSQKEQQTYKVEAAMIEESNIEQQTYKGVFYADAMDMEAAMIEESKWRKTH